MNIYYIYNFTRLVFELYAVEIKKKNTRVINNIITRLRVIALIRISLEKYQTHIITLI